jgi:probable rRNA maturation factor
MSVPVQVRVFNRQNVIKLPLVRLQKQLERAARLLSHSSPVPLPPAIEITLVDLAEMTRVHAQFLNDPTPTDVITFDHGEILVSPEVAAQRAPREGLTTAEETLLYGIHGLHHLVGWKDSTPAQARRMAAAQEQVLRQVLSGRP